MELTGPVRVTTPIGVFILDGNELEIRDGAGDCVKVRGQRQDAGAILALSADIYRPDPTDDDPARVWRSERVQVQLGTDAEFGGLVKVYVQDIGRDGDMGERQLALEINTSGIVSYKPFFALGGFTQQQPPTPAPTPPSDDTHGIAPGDFAEIARVYGFESDWQDVWHAARVTWPQVIARQDERDEYRHFPTSRPAPDLPPAPTPSPMPPAGTWLTPESQVKRRAELTRIAEEVAPMPLDDGRMKAYLMGRNRNLAEVHDDELARAAFDTDPCEGKNRIPIP